MRMDKRKQAFLLDPAARTPMSREELTEAIHDLADSPHMRQYALEHAMASLDLVQLGELLDTVADHHSVLFPVVRRNAGGGSITPRNPRLRHGGD